MEEFRKFIDDQRWIFSKKFADKAPHEYCLRKEVVGGDDRFVNAVMFIRENGFKALFWGREHIYYQIDGKIYWTMGSPIDETILINRCNADDYLISMVWRNKT